MAIVAVDAAGDVRCVFAGRGDAVMTRTASTQYLCVVDSDCRYKRCCVVAVLADISGLYVCRAFARGCCTIVTTDTITDDADMIEHGR